MLSHDNVSESRLVQLSVGVSWNIDATKIKWKFLVNSKTYLGLRQISMTVFFYENNWRFSAI